MTKEIELTRGFVALVDDDWFPVLSEFSWCVAPGNPNKNKMYVVHGVLVQTEPTKIVRHIHMHRLITNAQEGFMVDHRDGNPLNNQRCNLRVCTGSNNNMNRNIGSRNKSGFKGVYWDSRKGVFISRLQMGGKNVHYQAFLDPIMAARAYDVAALKFAGQFALTNEMMGLLKPEI